MAAGCIQEEAMPSSPAACQHPSTPSAEENEADAEEDDDDDEETDTLRTATSITLTPDNAFYQSTVITSTSTADDSLVIPREERGKTELSVVPSMVCPKESITPPSPSLQLSKSITTTALEEKTNVAIGTDGGEHFQEVEKYVVGGNATCSHTNDEEDTEMTAIVRSDCGLKVDAGDGSSSSSGAPLRRTQDASITDATSGQQQQQQQQQQQLSAVSSAHASFNKSSPQHAMTMKAISSENNLSGDSEGQPQQNQRQQEGVSLKGDGDDDDDENDDYAFTMGCLFGCTSSSSSSDGDKHDFETVSAYQSSLPILPADHSIDNETHRRAVHSAPSTCNSALHEEPTTNFEDEATNLTKREHCAYSEIKNVDNSGIPVAATNFRFENKSDSLSGIKDLRLLSNIGDSSSSPTETMPLSPEPPMPSPSKMARASLSAGDFTPYYASTRFFDKISSKLLRNHYVPFAAATWIGFWAMMHVTCANYVLTPMRDAIALQIGVEHIPNLTLVSTVLAFCSSVPIGWLFEAPEPKRLRLFRRVGLTRGETQGTSLALFYRCYAFICVSYAIGFELIEFLQGSSGDSTAMNGQVEVLEKIIVESVIENSAAQKWLWWQPPDLHSLWSAVSKMTYIAFFLVVPLMKLHSVSLVWGVTTEAMEYEEVARKRSQANHNSTNCKATKLQKLALVGFGGTLGGIIGSVLASSMAQSLRLPGLLVLAAMLLEVSAELSIELGRIMQKHWEKQQQYQSSSDLASLDSSMKRSASLGSMKRIASGNSINRVRSASNLSLRQSQTNPSTPPEELNDNTFMQRLLRGVTTILRSRLLMAIFTYNALYASTTVLLSFQRATLIANRTDTTSKEADTAFLANVSLASSFAIFVLQSSGLGAMIAQKCGPRGTLSLMPLVRLLGLWALMWWHQTSDGKPPNIVAFLIVDECTKIMNLAVAKPVRESLWSGLSNEARYEAKPIVDTLANRWGGGSAAFLVSVINRALDLFGVEPNQDGDRTVFGFPPIPFLCMIVAAWWTVVSADLGQIRRRIDLELKKVQ